MMASPRPEPPGLALTKGRFAPDRRRFARRRTDSPAGAKPNVGDARLAPRGLGCPSDAAYLAAMKRPRDVIRPCVYALRRKAEGFGIVETVGCLARRIG